MKLNIPVALITLLLALFSTGAQAVGFQHVTAPDPDGAPLEVGIWYPSNALPAPVPMGRITQTVAVNGAIEGKGLPLIVISHGTGGSFLGHYDTAIAFAEAGYVVAAVTHTGDNNADQSRSVSIMERPRHISRLIDYMLSDWAGRNQINPARIGMFGFSAGGFTTLVSIGGVPDLTKVSPFCREHTTDFACQLVAKHPEASVAPSVSHDGSQDLRIKAAVVAAPALGFTFAPDGLKNVTIPVALWRAENDAVLPHPWYAEAVHLALPRAPEYHVVENAGHFDFLAPCGTALASVAPFICTSAPGFDRTAFHTRLNASVVDFFDRVLKH
ncbi:Predicted dienelactone hydrolase [Collimonas sp. OK607]|uniref:alpha/beta hydrolase family protein n=1 Tax=Collimonas sp. OK607 TaxID=1798194 RepID=UPI0008E39BFB|nr:dienelactone hydrolase [Collimonas sp. OK607]SFB19871.1 Predicted dienelactone hydrolase [Collimonas sp. OK607]